MEIFGKFDNATPLKNSQNQAIIKPIVLINKYMSEIYNLSLNIGALEQSAIQVGKSIHIAYGVLLY